MRQNRLTAQRRDAAVNESMVSGIGVTLCTHDTLNILQWMACTSKLKVCTHHILTKCSTDREAADFHIGAIWDSSIGQVKRM